jgi:two-component sensor histidine kinase
VSVLAGGSRQDRKMSLPPISLRRLAVWVSLGLVCLAAVAALMLMQSIGQQIGDVTETQEVRTAARDLTNALSAAESGQRGFLLTQNEEFLAPYHAAVATIDQRVEALTEMTADDADQRQRVVSITGDIAGRLAEMARAVQLVEGERADDAQSLTETGMGARLMAEVTETLEAFIAEEDSKLAARNRAIDQSRFALVAALIAALVAAATLAYALLSRTQRRVKELARSRMGLLDQNEALEIEIASRTRDIEEARAVAERERQRVEILLQDTNHRIGNSLATVSSLLALQMLRTQSDEVRNALEAARLRVHAIASAHRRLRLGDELDTAIAAEFLQAVLDDIATTQSDPRRISIEGDIAPIEVNARDATTLGILVAELVTNALKHAFPKGADGTIRVTFQADAEGVPTIAVSDNGMGMGDHDPTSDKGLGTVIVKQLSSQFGGVPHYESAAPGLTVFIALPNLVRQPSRAEP